MWVGDSDPLLIMYGIFNFTTIKNLQIPYVFYFSFLFFLLNDSPLVIMKNAFYLIWKALFVFPVGHCFRGWSKINFSFLSNPAPFHGQVYEKQKEPGASDQLLFRLQNKFKKIPLLVIYYLNKFDDGI